MLEKLIVFVEEYSMEAALDVLLPGMLDEADYQIIRFQKKRRIEIRMISRAGPGKLWNGF